MVEAVSRYRSWIGWSLVVLAVAALAAVNPFGFDSHSLPKILLVRLAVVAMVVLWGVAVCFEGSLKIRRTPLDIPVLAIIAVGALSTIFAIDKRLAFYGDYKSYEGFLTLLVFAGLFYLASSFLTSHLTQRLAVALAAASGALGIYGIAQYFGSDFIAAAKFDGAVAATFGSSNAFGAFLAFALPFALALYLAAKSPRFAAALGALIAVLTVALVLNGTVGAWIAACIGLAALPAGSRRLVLDRKRKLAIGLLVVLLSAGAGAGIALFTKKSAPLARFEKHMAEQAVVWKEGAKLVLQRPLTGAGADNARVAYYRNDSMRTEAPDAGALLSGEKSGLLKAGIYGGLPGIAAFLAFIGMLLWAGYRVSKNSLINGAFWSGTIGLLVADAAFGAFSTGLGVLLWLSAAMLAASAAKNDFDLDYVKLRKIPPAVPIVAALIALGFAGFTMYKPIAADAAVEAATNPSEDSSVLEPERQLTRATLLNPGEKSYWLALGQIGLKLAEERTDPDEAREAEAALEKALALDPYDPNVHLARGRAFGTWLLGEDKKRLPKAVAAYKKAVELDPELAVAWYELGMAYVNQKKIDEAIKAWNQALKQDKKLSAVWFALGAAFEQKGDLAKAEENLREAVKVAEDAAIKAEIEAKLEQIAGKKDKTVDSQ